MNPVIFYAIQYSPLFRHPIKRRNSSVEKHLVDNWSHTICVGQEQIWFENNSGLECVHSLIIIKALQSLTHCPKLQLCLFPERAGRFHYDFIAVEGLYVQRCYWTGWARLTKKVNCLNLAGNKALFNNIWEYNCLRQNLKPNPWMKSMQLFLHKKKKLSTQCLVNSEMY